MGEKDYNKIKTEIKKEIALDLNDDIANITIFKVCSLSVDDHENHVVGKLTEFLINRYGKDDPPASSLFRVLKEFVSKKQNCEDIPHDSNELFVKKSIS